ncbi:MAG: transporter substrate-binding domain-containing protein [Ruminococcaceae bacterium]|nr:transporter substrate-binding domain-containing protein [Oscillospiraceae bacterium]
MKKILCLALALIMTVSGLFVLSSCSKEDLLIGKQYNALTGQTDVLVQLNSGSIDVGVMDSIMAGYYMSQDSAYSDKLMVVEDLTLATEQYGIAARKGSGFAKKINEALIQLANDGTVVTLAEKYGIASELCIDKNATVAEMTEDEAKDWNAIVEEGTFVVGYTLFAPIAYENDAGELIGFDIELAKAVAEVLKLEVKFELIEWSAKEAKLEGGSIDCIWNGMTITEERLAAMEISIPYLNNKQVAVIRKEDKEKYTTTESMSGAIMGAEAGSAGEACIKAPEENS